MTHPFCRGILQICLDMFEKVDVLEYYDIEVPSARDLFPLPAVVRVRMFLQRASGGMRVHLSRKNILTRDKHTCQCASPACCALSRELLCCAPLALSRALEASLRSPFA